MKGKERGGRVAGREGARPRSNSGGAEGCGLRLLEEEEPFQLIGKVHRRTSWAEGISDHLSFRLRKSVRFWRMLKSNVPTSGQRS